MCQPDLGLKIVWRSSAFAPDKDEIAPGSLRIEVYLALYMQDGVRCGRDLEDPVVIKIFLRCRYLRKN
jgi:hypothetical protein